MAKTGISRTAFLAAGAAASLTLGQTPRSASGQTPSASGGKATRILVLSGGTAHGAYEAGVLEGLARQPGYDYICGTSIGALNGGVISTGQPDKLRLLWRHIGAMTVLAPKRAYRHVFESSAGVGTRLVEGVQLLRGSTSGSLTGFMQSEPVRAILADVFVENGSLRSFVTPLYWTASNLTQGCAGFFSRSALAPQSLTLAAPSAALTANLVALGITARPASAVPSVFIEQLRASSAIPAVFEPALTEPFPTDTLVDGGVTNNTPFALVRAAARSGPVEVHTVLLGGTVASHKPTETSNIKGIVQACFGLMQQRLIDDAVRALASDAQQLRSRRQTRQVVQHLVDAQAQSIRSMERAMPAGRLAPFAVARQTSDAAADAALVHAQSLVDTAPVSNDVTIKFRAPSAPLAGTGFDFDNQTNVDLNYDLGKHDIEQLGWNDFVVPDDLCSLNGR